MPDQPMGMTGRDPRLRTQILRWRRVQGSLSETRRIAIDFRHRSTAAFETTATPMPATGTGGVAVLPVVPYLQAIGPAKDELLQALASPSPSWRWPACGWDSGLRPRLDAATVRRVFFAGLFSLGLYLALRGIA
jgi:hypothetical protein